MVSRTNARTLSSRVGGIAASGIVSANSNNFAPDSCKRKNWRTADPTKFLLRGVEKVRAEWAMICTAHNLL